MRILLAAFAAFFMSIAHAETYMVFPFNQEVRIVLSRQVCPGDKTKLLAVAQRIDKQYMRACWSLEPDQKLVRLQWEGGDFSIFDIDKFKPVTVQEKDKF